MEYKTFGKTGIRLSRLGFGMNRFPPGKLAEPGGVEKAAALVNSAVLEYGINYVDVAHTYSGSYAQKIISYMSHEAKQNCHFSVKTSIYVGDQTADDAYKRVCTSLYAMNLERVTFGFLWAVRSLDEYRIAVAEGGVYDGLARAKREGLIKHICVSLHTSPEDSLAILQEGRFEGVTLSCHALNVKLMEPVLSVAKELGMGVFTMNSLAGGMLLQYPQIMPELPDNYTVAQASFARLLDYPEITCCLSGMFTREQLIENTQTFQKIVTNPVPSWEQAGKIHQGFCTGCGYCADCPQGIPIPALMQGYNASLIDEFQPKYNVSDKKKLTDIYAFEAVKKMLTGMPENAQNPCIKCGKCERKCTQNLPIKQRVEYMYQRMGECSFSLQAWRERLVLRITESCEKTAKKVYFYPAGLYTKNVIRLYCQLFGRIDFDLHIFDRDPSLVGMELINGYIIESIEQMKDEEDVLCVITNYAHEADIYKMLSERYSRMQIVKLHEKDDVPWLYLYW